MNQRNILSSELADATSGISRSLGWRGFAWAAALPGLGLLLFYGLVLHTRLALGRWPNFGERLPTQILSLHNTLVWDCYAALFFSLYAVPILIIVSVCFRKTRRFAFYLFAYAMAAILAGALVQLAPHSFLNWFFD